MHQDICPDACFLYPILTIPTGCLPQLLYLYRTSSLQIAFTGVKAPRGQYYTLPHLLLH